MRTGIDLSANNTYIEFSFEKSLRKYQKNPHKKVKCNLSNMKQKQTCSHCIEKINKINSLAYSQRASILQESRTRYNKKSRDKVREYSEQRNSQNMISADHSRIKLTTQIQQKTLKEISNFNISQHKQQSYEKEQQINHFEYTLNQNQQKQNVIHKVHELNTCKGNESPKKALDFAQQDQSFSNIELSQVKSKVNNGFQFNILGQQQLKNSQSDCIATKEYLKDEEHVKSKQKIQVQNKYFQQQEYYQSAVQPSYFCFSESQQEDLKYNQMMCEQNHSISISDLKTPVRLWHSPKPQKEVQKQKLNNNKIQRLQIETKNQLKQESKKQYRQRVIFKLQRINDLQSNCMQCQKYSLQIKNTIKVQLQKMQMDEEFNIHPQAIAIQTQIQINEQKKNQIQQAQIENETKETKHSEDINLQIRIPMQIQEQNHQIIQQNVRYQIQSKALPQALTLSMPKEFSQCKMQLKRQRRERQRHNNEQELLNFGRFKLNKSDNKQILCLSMRSLNRFIQKNWTVEQITSQLISRRPYLQENFNQICQMVKNYLPNYKRK